MHRHARLILALAAAALIAAVLRFWSIDFALEVERARPDEEFISGKALEMVRSGDWNPHFFHYPTLLTYVNGLLLQVLPDLRDPESARLVSRLISAGCGIANVILLGRLGAQWISPFAGGLGALFLAVAYLDVRLSHFGTTDVPVALLVTATLLLAWKGRSSESARSLRLAGMLAGLAMSVKYPGVLALIPVVVAVCGIEAWTWSKRLTETALAGILAFVCFSLTSPYVLLDAEAAWQSLSEVSTETWGAAAPERWDPLLPFTFSLHYGLGLPLLSLGVCGWVVLARQKEGRFLLAWVVPYYIAAASTAIHFARYAHPLVPAICLGAAGLLDRFRNRRILLGALVMVAALPTLIRSVEFNRLLGRPDTRVLASEWIARHIPVGTTLMISTGYGAPPVPAGYPARWVRFRLPAVVEGERAGVRYLVTHEHPDLARFSRIDARLRRRLDRAEQLWAIDPLREVPSGIYDRFDAFYLPYADFDRVDRPGPRISVWKLE